jgi:hypothetical protein
MSELVERAVDRWTIPVPALFTILTLSLEVSLQTKLRMLFKVLGPSGNDVLGAEQVVFVHAGGPRGLTALYHTNLLFHGRSYLVLG